MGSINSFFTFNYVQPEEYRFSHDSVFLARQVFELLSENLEGKSGLDLCSGCGVIGLDFLFHLKESNKNMPEVFDFLEVQETYKKYFDENKLSFGESLPPVKFLNENYAILKTEEYKEKYDLILSNPPYFRVEQGVLSPSEFKNRCRFFIDSDFKTLIEGINNTLKSNGSAYILLRDLKAHGVNPLEEAQKFLGDKRKISKVSDIRGTPLVLIR